MSLKRLQTKYAVSASASAAPPLVECSLCHGKFSKREIVTVMSFVEGSMSVASLCNPCNDAWKLASDLDDGEWEGDVEEEEEEEGF